MLPASFRDRMGKEFTVFPIQECDHPTIFPGLKVRFAVYVDDYATALRTDPYHQLVRNEKNKTNILFEKVYGNLFYARINAYKGDTLLFKYYPQTEDIFISPENELVAYIEEDSTFVYDPCSMDEKRYILQIDDGFIELLPNIFHAFLSVRMGAM